MDRLSWYQPGESMEEIICQAGHVGIYDGDLKQSAFEVGTASLTLQRIIWADSTDPDCRLILHHSLVNKIEKHHKTMFGRGGKIIVTVNPVSHGGHAQGPVAASGCHSLRFVFRNGGEDEFYKNYCEALNRQTWKRTSSSSSSGGSRNSHMHSTSGSGSLIGSASGRNVGIIGIEKRLAEQNQKTHDSIGQAFEDMSRLMEQAREMVNLSKSITEKLRLKKGEITDDETVKFKSYLLSLGVSDPVTKNSFGTGAVYFEKLAQELSMVLLKPLQECGGTMTLPEAFCRMNRARGVELISPEDLLNACQKLEKIQSPLCLFTFESGVTILQLKSTNPELITDEICELIKSLGSIDATQLAKISGISTVLATERMGVLTLNIEFRERGVKKTMQFEPRIVVYDACRLIRDKLGPLNDNPNHYGLFRVEDDPTKCVWMENGRTLEYYLIRNGDTLEYKNKIRQLRVRTLDGATVKKLYVDESQPISQLMIDVCSKMGISNHEEYSLVRDEEGTQGDSHGPLTNGDGKYTNGYHTTNNKESRSVSAGYRSDQSGKKENTFMNTIGRKKERQIQQLRAKLHTDDDIRWVDQSKTLREQNIGEAEELTLRRKFFFSDTNVDTRDPVQLNLLYIQCRDGVLKGLHPVSRDTAIKLAALQSYIEHGPFHEGIQKSIDAKDLLPKEYSKAKELEKNIVQEYRELMYEDQAAPKKKYCELCQSLPTYGVTFFLVKEKLPGKNRLIPRLLGVNKESVMRVDEKTKAVLKEWPLEQVRRWAASYKTFTLDFGDYKDGYYSVQTIDGEKICQLIGGYIDIILKKKRINDSLGIEGDEGSTMLEDVVAPARATLIAHGELGQGFAEDGHVALPGVLRSTQGTPAIGQPGGLQYGAVGGRIIEQELPRGERIRYMDSQERSQRALVGTIEATIRAVEEAEEEMAKPPQIELPSFGDTSRHWRVEVEKEAVGDRIAAMGAATAEVVQLTAIPEETDNRVGTAIATIGSNLPEMGRGVRELAAMLPDEHRAGDLIEAARKLCGAFGNFLDKVHPEKQEKRANILSAASRVGELSHDVINTINDQSQEDHQFHDQLNQRARNVATSTAKLVLQAKTVSADCQEPALKDQVIHSAMKTAFATSELIACTRVVGPTLDHPPCREHLTEAAHNVARAVEELLVDANSACKRTASGTGEQQYGDLHAAARQVSNALDDLIDHVKLSPGQHYHRKTQQDYSYEQILQSSNRVITNQGPQRDLVRDSESAIRHSRLLVDEFENEAQKGAPDQRDKLLNAARSVAQATSNMIDATKECQSRPQEVEAQMALRNAAENLVQVTSEATSERLAKQTIQNLERAAKDTSAAATQTIAAIYHARPHIVSKTITETLVIECTKTSRYIPAVVQRIKENQSAQTAGEQFRAQSGLIHETSVLIPPASQLVEASRSAIPHVNEQHTAQRLLTTSQELSTQLAELRVALNNAQQLNFDLQLEHSEDLIRELDHQLQEIGHNARRGQLRPPPEGLSQETAANSLTSNARLVGSGIAQLVSAARINDRQHVGASALEAAQALRSFTSSIHGVATTRQDASIDSLILNARSVVHDSGRVFDRVREKASPSQLEDCARMVSESLKKTLACLPDNAAIEEAISRIQKAPLASTTTTINGHSIIPQDLRTTAAKLIESSSELVVSVRAPHQSGAVDVFLNSYENFHTTVVHSIHGLKDGPQRQHLGENLEVARDQSLNLLYRLRAAHADPNNLAYSQSLSQASRSLTDTVNIIVEKVTSRGEISPWSRECDNALQQIQAMRHVLDEAATQVPINQNSYYDSLGQVTNEARHLGDGMNGLAHYARRDDTAQLCMSVRAVAQAVCGLVEHSAQSAYLIGAGEAESQPGKPAIFDTLRCANSLQAVKQIAESLENGHYNKAQIINDATIVATHTSNLATICREASEHSTNVNVKRQFVNCARDITSATAALIHSVKKVDQSDSEQNHKECSENAHQLRVAAENLEAFVGNPEFGPVPARISHAGRQAQLPVLQSARQMLDASCEMISTAKNLDVNPTDASIWQRIANNSSIVSESIKHLVAAIRDEAPGQADLDAAIHRLNQLIQEVDSAALASQQQQNSGPRNGSAEQLVRQHILHSSQTLLDRIDGLKNAAIGHAEAIGHAVREHMSCLETLVHSCIQAASLSYDLRTQINLFEQCKTVIEAEIQMFFATKDSGGNPKAVELHTIVEESAEQLATAIGDLQCNVNVLNTESGVIHGIVETISRSISLADQTRQTPPGNSFADTQTRMVNALNEISQIATDMPITETQDLGQLSLRLAERYKELVEEARIAQNLLTSPNLAQKIKVSVQKLGTVCIDVVKVAGQRRAHPNDERIYQQLSQISEIVVERVREVLAALSEGSRGTQACINAAQTVSGIIGDLDTTIMFATSGSLNPPASIAANEKKVVGEFPDHRDVIIKTAKALVEDTKALVTGAASNQEQLAVAAQNAVRSILSLTEAVKGGAAALSTDSAESQIMIIHAVRDVAAALSNLIQATKHASGRSQNDPAIGNLKEAAKVMVTNVSSLLRTIKTVEDSGQRGTQALEAAVNAIDIAVRQYDNNEAPGRHAASAEEVIRTTRHVTEAITKATNAASSLHEEQVIQAANLARQAVGELLVTTRAAALNAENADLKYHTLDCGRDVALQVKHLLATLHALLSRPDDRQVKNSLLVAAKEVSKVVGDLAQCAEQLRADASTAWPTNENGSEASAIMAENELLGAANSIEEAAVKLARLKPRQVHKPDENWTFDEQILSAAKSIAAAVQTLVKAASGAQRELVAQGRMEARPAMATDDFQWSEGLISAARLVAAAVHQLCEAANGLVQGHSTEEKLISAAKQVASSTAHLLVACKVKSDLDSRAMQRLQIAGHAVKTATEHLVNAARQAITEDERTLVISDRMVTGIAQVMDAQEVVLRKERELVEARNRLAQINKSRYEKSPEP